MRSHHARNRRPVSHGDKQHTARQCCSYPTRHPASARGWFALATNFATDFATEFATGPASWCSKLDKAQQLSNWAQRPLTSEQTRYAADDGHTV
eukprot:579203-Prorocentrum_minimum.AAC.4